MKGIVLLGDGELEVRWFPDPIPGPQEVVVRVKTAAICGSDIHMYHAPKGCGSKHHLIAGHEPAGIVDSVGPDVTLVKPGDRVSVYHYIGCGKCKNCLAGFWQWCPETKGLGAHINGADAEFVLVKEQNCFVLPDELSFIDGSFMACAAGTTYSALMKLQPNGATTIAVIGLGPVGLCGVAMSKAMGARVVAIGRRKIRLDLAKELGADCVVDAADPDVRLELQRLLPGGVDLVYETSGAPEAQQLMVGILKPGGKACVVAGRGPEPTINAAALIGRQLTIMGSFVLPIWMVPEMAAFIVRHKIPFEKMVTHRFSIDQAKEAFELFDSGECGKVVFEF
ncbi:MAG: alcohol dehydrogenase catalytic domain-containing protein [Armatimonadota bacterium]|nr:alcohol dehydrogenase catalytic domain-containing protein [Armatimonadota bacterium]